MVTRNELEAMRQEARKVSEERNQLMISQAKETEDFHRRWKTRLSEVKIVGTDRIKPFIAEKEKAYDNAKNTLMSEMNRLDDVKKRSIKAINECFEADKKIAMQECKDAIEKAGKAFDRHSVSMKEELEVELRCCEIERDEALEALNAKHEEEKAALSAKLEEIQGKMQVVGAA